MLRKLAATALIAALALAAVADAAAADKKKKDAAPAPTFNGTITKVSDDGKFITFRPQKTQKNKKQTGVMEVKVTPDTKVEFLGFDSKDSKTIKEGLGILVTVNDNTRDTALTMKISKDAPKDEPKKKKAKAAA